MKGNALLETNSELFLLIIKFRFKTKWMWYKTAFLFTILALHGDKACKYQTESVINYTLYGVLATTRQTGWKEKGEKDGFYGTNIW